MRRYRRLVRNMTDDFRLSDTGRIERKTKTGEWQCVCAEVSLRGKAYRQVSFQGRTVNAHRFAWFLVFGKWPEGQIDHIDGDGLNNCIDNLRDVTNTINQRNRKRNRNNTSGLTGVRRTQYGTWQVRPTINNKKVHIGTFKSHAEAEAALRAFHEAHGFHANHGRR